MATDQYHEPPSELPEETRTFARLLTSMIEEAEAIGWYDQRLAVEKDKQASSIMEHAMQEEMIHFSMDLEFLLRQKPTWRTILKNVLHHDGEITELAENAEEEAME